MRTNFIPAALAAVAIHLFANPDVHAQGTIFLSNLGQPSSESLPVGSDSWYAEEFSAGTNSSVYALNAIQVVMGGASGNPNGFMVSLHTNATGGFGSVPGGSVGQLIGPSAPEANGVYTYTAVSPIMIERNVSYYIVVTAGTPVTTGAYPWSTASVFSYASPDGWLAGPTRRSSDGLSWVAIPDSYPTANPGRFPLFAISGTAVPEPSSLALLSYGALMLAARGRRVRHR